MEVKKGGKREGSGRPKKTWQTKSVTFHIKLEWEQKLRDFFKSLKDENN